MNEADARNQMQELIDKAQIVMVGSIDDQTNPNIKAMLYCKSEGLKRFWFSTNTDSDRVRQYEKNAQACIYFLDSNYFKGLMLTGTMSVKHDLESRQLLWKEGDVLYYPLGINDPDYSVLYFEAKRANYYYNLEKIQFDL